MALYLHRLTIPANTPDGAPVGADLHIIGQTIVRVELRFPNGCLNAVGVRLVHDGAQFAPRPAGWIFGNNTTVAWREALKLAQRATIRLEGYSLAEDYPHTVSALIEVEP